MKKLKQKMSKITKIFLVLALIFSNLSCLSTVFAYEGEESKLMLELDKDNNQIKITYQEELEEEHELYVKVSEKYTYLDETYDESNRDPVSVSLEELNNGYGYSLQLFTVIRFDGTYDIDVSLGYYNEEEFTILDSNNYNEVFNFEKGFSYMLKEGNNDLPKVDDTYLLPDGVSSFIVIYKLNMGGITPEGHYFIGEEEFLGTELQNYITTDDYDMMGHLYGPHQLSLNKSLTDEEGNVVSEINEEIKIKYGELEDNDDVINSYLSSNNIDWNVETVNEKGLLYINPITNSENIPTVYDLDKVMSELTENSEITYTITNKNGEDVTSGYTENEEQTLEDYLKTIKLENGMVLSISCCDSLTIKYTITFIGDFNNDGILSQEDIQALIDNTFDYNEIDNVTKDINKDNIVDILDITYYLNILNDIEVPEEPGTVSARLENNNTVINTGEEFTIDYIVSASEYALNGIEGVIQSDASGMQLLGVSVASEGLYGNRRGNVFTYVSNAELKNADYKVLTLKYKALEEGDYTIRISNNRFANGGKELELVDEDVSVNITINASDNANVSRILINGEDIELTEGKYDYETSVSSDTTEIDLDVILENDSASKTIDGPETLEYGNNEYTITVTAKNGDVQIYKVNVVREEPEEEEAVVEPVVDEEESTPTATPVTNTETSTTYNNPVVEDKTVNVPTDGKTDDVKTDIKKKDKKGLDLSKIIMIILILLVIAALIYLIFKDDDEEEKKANKDINKFKKDTPQNNYRSDPRDNKPKNEPQKSPKTEGNKKINNNSKKGK